MSKRNIRLEAKTFWGEEIKPNLPDKEVKWDDLSEEEKAFVARVFLVKEENKK